MKRKSQSRTEHQKSEPAAPKNPVTSEKTQSDQCHCGSLDYDQPAAPGTVMEFSFKGCTVRTVSYEAGTWFVGADVCAVLEHTDPSAALLRLDKDEKGATTVRTLGGNQKMKVVTESSLYHLVLTSRKLQAKAFRRWVTGTVLPSIRQTGGNQSSDDARTARACGDARQDAVTVVLPGPGRYVATVVPDGAVHVHETECRAVLHEMTLTDCRILCHTLKIIEGQWHRFSTGVPLRATGRTRLDWRGSKPPSSTAAGWGGRPTSAKTYGKKGEHRGVRPNRRKFRQTFPGMRDCRIAKAIGLRYFGLSVFGLK